MCSGTSSDNAFQSGSPLSTAASVSERSSPAKAPPTGQHLVQHAAERPDVTRACPPAALGLFGAMYAAVPENHAHPGHHCRRR